MARLQVRLRPWPVTALVAWTLFCWTTRVPLLWTLHQSEADKLRETIPVLIFVAIALVTLAGVLRSGEVLAGRARAAAIVLAVWSTGYWVLRLPFILANHHPVAFDAVHSILALVTVGLSIWALGRLSADRSSRRESTTVSSSA